jgi:pimeloyl-ACP methyl ester carboxylesterase
MISDKKIPNRWILVRGLARSRYHWKNFDSALKTGLGISEVLFTELSGNGYLHQENTPKQLSEIIKNFDAQIPDIENESFGVIGISLGGMLATEWAKERPEKFSHLVLINSSSSLSPITERMFPTHYYSIIKNLAKRDSRALESFILNATSNKKEIWEPQLEENINFIHQHPTSVSNFIRQLKLTTKVNFSPKPFCNKLILTSRADRLVNYKCSEDISNLWQCPIRYHHTAGHDLPMDDAPWVVEQIANEFGTR